MRMTAPHLVYSSFAIEMFLKWSSSRHCLKNFKKSYKYISL